MTTWTENQDRQGLSLKPSTNADVSRMLSHVVLIHDSHGVPNLMSLCILAAWRGLGGFTGWYCMDVESDTRRGRRLHLVRVYTLLTGRHVQSDAIPCSHVQLRHMHTIVKERLLQTIKMD